MNVCVLLYTLLFITTNAFDVDVFLSLNCYKKEDESLTEASIKEHTFCERFTLNAKEVEELQTLNFVISNENSMVFKNCDIGIFNDNFLKKFPSALSIQLHNVTFTMTSSSGINHPLRELSIYGGNITSKQYYKAWRNLAELRTFVLGSTSTSGKYLMQETMFQDFFRGNKKLESIKIFKENITHIDPFVFRGLPDLRSVHLTDLNLKSLPPRLFYYIGLENVDLSGNKFDRFPQLSEINVNSTLQQVVLIGCNIKNVTKMDLRYLTELQYLVLDGNKIESFDKEVFKELPNLRYLSLVGNELKNQTLLDFGMPPHLEALNVEWNYLNITYFIPDNWNEEFEVEYLNQWSNEVKKEMGPDGKFSVVAKDVV